MLLNVLKPKGITSHDVVDKIRRITKEKKVGHSGTLDPFAEGVLIIAVSRESTKELQKLLKSDKEYIALIELGKESSTGDPEGKITVIKEKINISRKDIEKVLPQFTGEIEQTPPIYSAIKIKGVPAYKLAIKGKTVNLKKRKVTINSIEILSFKSTFLELKIRSSSGTYIRTLSKDIGEKLGVGAYVKELKRTRVGAYSIEDSKTLKEIELSYLVS